jgi:predicted 3-demethylubiquinone-9 3-methyltransferase (glyoxalase superfamily)
MQKIVTSLWFDTEAEEAANFYARNSATRRSSTSPTTARPAPDPRAW